MIKIRLKEIMKEQGVTAVALADKIGVSRVTIGNLANGITAPSLETISNIAEALNVPMWQMFASQSEIKGNKESASDTASITCPYCGKTINLNIDKEKE